LPMVQRGFHQGFTDLTTYYHSFLQQFASGRVVADYTNQNLGAMVYRAVVPRVWGQGVTYNYVYLPSLETAAPLIYRVLALLIVAAFLAHLVILFVYYAFFLLDPGEMGRRGRVALGLVWIGMGAIGFGRDLIGDRLHHYVGGYSVIVWVMLLLFGLSIAWSQAKSDQSSF